MMQRSRAFAVISFVFVILVCHDFIRYLRYKKSILPASFYRAATNWVLTPSHSPADLCFDSFFLLLANHSVSEKFFLVEPNPPIPLSAVNGSCRNFLQAKPPPPWVSNQTLNCFRRRLVREEFRGRIRDCLLVVKKLFERHKIPLIVYAGSLIGSWRHHGMIPYDDDFDFRFPRSHKPQVKRLLRELANKDQRFSYTDTDRKLGHLQMRIACVNRSHCPSFIDFFYFWHEHGVIRVLEWPHQYPKTMFFPLIKRPLEGEIYDALHDYPLYLSIFYKNMNTTTCASIDHNKIARKGCSSIECSYLNSVQPFVVTASGKKGRLELVVKSAHIHSFFFQRADGS